MTVSKKITFSSRAIVANDGFANSAWDNLNPLYCANQQYLFANAISGLSPLQTGRFLLTASPEESNTKLYVLRTPYSINATSTGAGTNAHLLTLRVDYGANTVNAVATANDISFLSDAIVLANNRILTHSKTANSIVSLKVYDVNATSGVITVGAQQNVVISTNTANASATYNITYVNENKMLLSYTDYSNTSYFDLRTRILFANTTGGFAANTPIEIANSTTVFSAGVSSINFYGNTTQKGVLYRSSDANNTFHIINTTANTLTSIFSNQFSYNQSIRTLNQISDKTNYFITVDTSLTTNPAQILSFQSNNFTFIGNTAISNRSSQIVKNKNTYGVLNWYRDPTLTMGITPYREIYFSGVNSVSNTIFDTNSKFPMFEIAGRVFSNSIFIPSEGLMLIEAFSEIIDVIPSTTRGIVITTGGARDTVSNNITVSYRFLDANLSSQTTKYTTPGSVTYTAPAAGQIILQCYGPGGRGRTQNANLQVNSNSRGGGGGGFSYKVINVTAGQNVDMIVGRGSNSSVTGTNTTANTIVCQPGGDATTGAVGVGGPAAGGDLNANGESGVLGSYTYDSKLGASDTGRGGYCGSPGPVRTGSGLVSTTQVYGVTSAKTLPFAAGSFGSIGEQNLQSNGVILVGFKPN